MAARRSGRGVAGVLAAIGLDERQESAYRALVAAGGADVTELARRLSLTEPDTERALRVLEGQGLVASPASRSGHWIAAPPGAALGALLAHRRHELERAELTAVTLAREYRAEAVEPAVHDLVEVVSGADAVADRLRRLRRGAAEEVRALIAGESLAVGRADGEAEERAARGVRLRVVIGREILASPAAVTGLGAVLGREDRARVTARVATELVIADRAAAMVPLTGRGTEPAALVVHGGGLLEPLLGLFEAVWREGSPLRFGGDGTVAEDGQPRPDATDLQVLSLLLAGLTDASVARQLDLGLRTVQRRVKRMMELSGVSTRLQLGWYAYEKGWVAREAPARARP